MGVAEDNRVWLREEQMIRSGTKVRIKSMEVSCPTCHEGPGTECQDLRRGQEDRRILVPHYERLVAAFRALKEQT